MSSVIISLVLEKIKLKNKKLEKSILKLLSDLTFKLGEIEQL